MLREAATLARQDLAGLRPEERVELLDRQLSGAPLPPAPATEQTETGSRQLCCGAGAWQPPQTLTSHCCAHPYISPAERLHMQCRFETASRSSASAAPTAPRWQRSSCSKRQTVRCGSGTYISDH